MKRSTTLLLLGCCLLTILSTFACITPKKGPARKLIAIQKISIIPLDAIIVPGIPYDGVTWDSVMKARVVWAWVLYKNKITSNIIFSGGSVHNPYCESRVMGLFAQKLGIPAGQIYYDTLAKHSTENVYYSYLLARKIGFKSIALATDPFQDFMLRNFIKRRFESPIYHLPFVTDSLAKYNYLSPTINATPAWEPNWVPKVGNESMMMRIRGTMGKKINWHQYKNGKVGKLN